MREQGPGGIEHCWRSQTAGKEKGEGNRVRGEERNALGLGDDQDCLEKVSG